MANEKIMILKMLEEGKITAEEAARLMEASSMPGGGNVPSAGPGTTPVGASAPTPPPSAGGPDYSGYAQNNQGGHSATPPSSPKGYTSGSPSSDYSSHSRQQQQAPSGSSGFDSFADDLSRKFDALAKDMEPKIQRFAETVVDKTAGMAEKISKSLSTPSGPRPTYASTPPSPGPSAMRGNIMEKQFEMTVTPGGYSELNMSGINGNVLINGYNGDKITAKVSYRPKFPGAAIELMKLGDKYYLNYDEEQFEYIAIDAFVPETMLKNVKIETSNGQIVITSLAADFLTVIALNGNTELKNVRAENLKVDCNNGGLSLLGIAGRNAQVDSFNGSVSVTSLDIANLKLSALNGSVNMNIDYLNNFEDYIWELEASNGKFVMNLPTSPSLGYYIKAQTSLNNVRLGLTGLNYIVNNPNFAEAKSISYDEAQKHIKISVETSNAPLNIN